MSFKLIATHVISEPKFSMIVTRNLHPSYRSFKNNPVRRKLSLTSEALCCCSLTISGPPNLSRSYSTNFSSDVQCSRADNLDVQRQSSDLVNKYLKSLTGHAKKPGGSLKKFEPCYRPLYPSKKSAQPTYKIPRKLPYVPAVFQPRKKPVIKYRLATPTSRLHPTFQWPPLYKSKKKNAERRSRETRPKTGELPPWLLPLYSYKAGRPEDMASLSEARYSGGAFHRRMEFLEGVKMIRDKQRSLTNRMNEEMTVKEVNKKPEQFVSKRRAAVNDLKRKIGEMYAMMGSVKSSESFQQTQLIREQETAEGNKSYSNKDGQLVNMSKYSVKTQSGDDSFRTQCEQSITNQHEVCKISGFNLRSCINHRQYDPQPLISLQNSTEVLGRSNYKTKPESRTVNYKLGSHSEQMEPSSIPQNTHGSKNGGLMKKENTVVDSNEWSVQSLKSRINDMLANEEEKLKKITTNYKEVVGVPMPSTDVLRANVTRPSNRSFHQCSSRIAESKLKQLNPTGRGVATHSNNSHSVGNGLPLRSICGRSYVGRRCSSTFSVSKGQNQPKTVHLLCMRSSNHAIEFPLKKTNWITRIKRCFMIKRVKRVKVEDWKKTPRKIPYCVKSEDTPYSPSPVLWAGEEKSVTQYQQESSEFGPEGRYNPAVLNAEQRIMASINRIAPTPISKFQKHSAERTVNLVDAEDSRNQSDSISLLQQEAIDSRLSDIEQKVRKAEIKVNILPLPWPNEGKSSDKITKLPELSSFQNDKLCSGTFTDLEKQEETGYEWMMNNKQTVEDIKYRSRQFAGKPLVPPHVKQSIEEYKLPLRAQISQYRKSIERKAHGLYFYSTARRWYSTSCYGPCFQSFCYPKSFSFLNSLPKLLQRSHTDGIGARKMSSNASSPNETQSPRARLRQNTSPTVLVGSEFYKRYALRPMYGNSSQDEPYQLYKDPNSIKSWANSKRARAIPRRPAAPLTSPNKMLHKVADTSSPSLKKQVDDLKRLIRKSKGLDRIPEKLEEFRDQSLPGESYEIKLRKLVRAAQANAKQMKLVEPKYHTENNLRNKIPSKEKMSVNPESVEVHKPVSPGLSPPIPLLSVTNVPTNSSTFFTKLGKDSRIENRSLKTKLQVSRSVSLDSFHTNKKPFSSMYLKIKSFVESLQRKSTQETSAPRITPSNKLKRNMSVCSFLSAQLLKKEEPTENESVSQINKHDSGSASITFEIHGSQTATPESSIRLWKTEQHEKSSVELEASKPSVLGIEPSSHGDLMSLLSKAQELITFHSQLNVQEQINVAKLTEKNSDNPNVVTTDDITVRILSPEEVTHNLLTKAELLKSATEISDTTLEKINAKVCENKTRFWPGLSSFPQSVFGKMNQVDVREANDKNSIVDQDMQKSCDNVLRSFTEPTIPSHETTQNIQPTYEIQDNKTHSIKDGKEGTHKTSRLADASAPAPQEEQVSAHRSAETSKQFISKYLSPEASTLGILEPTNRPAERLVDCFRDLHSDPNILAADKFDPKNIQNCLNGIDLQNNTHGRECLTKALCEGGNFVPKCEGTQAGGSTLYGVSSMNWEMFSRNPKNPLPQNDISIVKNIEQEVTSVLLPVFSKEKVTCNELVTVNLLATPQLDRANISTKIYQKTEHSGNNNEGNTHSTYKQSEFSSSLNSPCKSHHINEDVTGSSNKFSVQVPDTLKHTYNDATAGEEDQTHVDELKNHNRSSLTELLATDPTIKPELVEKLKLPVIHPDDNNEKTWCTRSRNS